MKRFIFFIIAATASISAFAQSWTAVGTSMYSPTSATSYVGIGTIPSYKLDVNGKLCLRSCETVAGLSVSYLTWTGHVLNMGSPVGSFAHNFLDLKPGGSSNGQLHSILRMYTALGVNNQVERVHLTSYGDCWFNSLGNVGIGTTTPQYNLDVNGTIRAREIVVNTTGADFVFEDSYHLMPLGEVKEYIETNHHLPSIQSAAEMQQNGVSISELQTQLLQKVEELTLYILQQQATIENLQNEISELKK